MNPSARSDVEVEVGFGFGSSSRLRLPRLRSRIDMKLQQDLDETPKSGFVDVPEVVSAQYVVSETLCLSVESNKHWSWCGEEITIENDHAQRPFTVESTGHGSILVRDISGNGLVFLRQQVRTSLELLAC